MTDLARKALAILSALVLESGRRWAEVAEPFQLADARAVLGAERPYHFLTRSRGGSKTTDLAAVSVGPRWPVTVDG